MKWSNHIAIARAVASLLEMPKNEERLLVEGSVDPDRNPNLVGGAFNGRRMPHHKAAQSVILDHLWEARSQVLIGQRSLAMLNLGRALHYIQDRSVGFSSRKEHDIREERLSREEPDLKAIWRGIRASRPSSRFVRKVVKNVRPMRRTSKIMSNACFASGAIAATVLRSPSRVSPKGIWRWSITLPIGLLLLALSTYGYLYLDYPFLGLLFPISLLLIPIYVVFAIRRRERVWWDRMDLK